MDSPISNSTILVTLQFKLFREIEQDMLLVPITCLSTHLLSGKHGVLVKFSQMLSVFETIKGYVDIRVVASYTAPNICPLFFSCVCSAPGMGCLEKKKLKDNVAELKEKFLPTYIVRLLLFQERMRYGVLCLGEEDLCPPLNGFALLVSSHLLGGMLAQPRSFVLP